MDSKVFAGRYQLLDQIGEGGAAQVYRAKHMRLDRIVAIKLLRDSYSHDASFLQRFENEARAVARLSHPNIVNVFDYDQTEGHYFIAMEYVPGSLRDYMNEHAPLSEEETRRLITQILAGLAVAHDAGLVHRDLKPQNVLMARGGEPKITDFGIAKAMGSTGMTRTGTVFGTPHYMSPEQVRGQAVGPRSDLYAVGVMMYEMLSGRLPFDGDEPMRIMYAHVFDQPAPLQEVAPNVSPEVAEVVHRALAKDPVQRYRDARELLSAIGAGTAAPGGANLPSPGPGVTPSSTTTFETIVDQPDAAPFATRMPAPAVSPDTGTDTTATYSTVPPAPADSAATIVHPVEPVRAGGGTPPSGAGLAPQAPPDPQVGGPARAGGGRPRWPVWAVALALLLLLGGGGGALLATRGGGPGPGPTATPGGDIAGVPSPSVAATPRPSVAASPDATAAATRGPGVPPTKVAPPTRAPTKPMSTATPSVLTTQQIFEKLAASTVKVEASFTNTAIDFPNVGSGTGVVYDLKNGYILTNAHVVEGAASVKVAPAGTSDLRSARLLGRAECDDLAVLQVTDTRGLAAARLGDSNKVTPGETVTALGYPDTPGGAKPSVTAGEVSGTGQQAGIYQDLVRHSAAVAPGNSGGPLTNSRGEVIGITTTTAVEDGGGLSSAIAINHAKGIVGELQRGQNRDYVGLNLAPNEFADLYGREGGLAVAAVASGSPAARAGVMPEDLLLKMEGRAVDQQTDVCNVLRSRKPGDVVSMQVYRRGSGEVLQGPVSVGQAAANAPQLKPVTTANVTPTAPSQASPTPAPTTGGSDIQTVVDENFEGTPKAFTEFTYEGYTGRFDNGAFNISLIDENLFATIPGAGATDISFGGIFTEVKVQGGGAAGIYARLQEVGADERYNMYACWITDRGTYGCDRYEDSVRQPIVKEQKSPVIKPNGNNTLSFIMVENSMKLTVNGEELEDITDDKYDRGGWGLYVRTDEGEGNLKAQFDNVSILEGDE